MILCRAVCVLLRDLPPVDLQKNGAQTHISVIPRAEKRKWQPTQNERPSAKENWSWRLVHQHLYYESL